MPSNKISKKENKNSCIFLIVNIGLYTSILNILLFSFLFFVSIQLFIDPLNFILWISILGTFIIILLISIIVILLLFSKIIINNELFIKKNQKQEKKYFIAAILFFFFNSLISFSMFKKLLITEEEAYE